MCSAPAPSKPAVSLSLPQCGTHADGRRTMAMQIHPPWGEIIAEAPTDDNDAGAGANDAVIHATLDPQAGEGAQRHTVARNPAGLFVNRAWQERVGQASLSPIARYFRARSSTRAAESIEFICCSWAKQTSPRLAMATA